MCVCWLCLLVQVAVLRSRSRADAARGAALAAAGGPSEPTEQQQLMQRVSPGVTYTHIHKAKDAIPCADHNQLHSHGCCVHTRVRYAMAMALLGRGRHFPLTHTVLLLMVVLFCHQ